MEQISLYLQHFDQQNLRYARSAESSPVPALNLVLAAVMSCATPSGAIVTVLASLVPFINVQTYLLTSRRAEE